MISVAHALVAGFEVSINGRFSGVDGEFPIVLEKPINELAQR